MGNKFVFGAMSVNAFKETNIVEICDYVLCGDKEILVKRNINLLRRL